MEESTRQSPDETEPADNEMAENLVVRSLTDALGGVVGSAVVVETDSGVEISFSEADGSTAA